MKDADLDTEWAELVSAVEEGDLAADEIGGACAQLRVNLTKRRRELLAELEQASNPMLRAAILERITEYRRMQDELGHSQDQIASRRLAGSQMSIQRDAIAASREHAAAVRRQARSLNAATWILAFATLGLIVATLVRV